MTTMRTIALAGAAAAATLGGTPAVGRAADGTRARVVRVVDGDTVRVATKREVRQVHLAGIDAPERGECLGTAARKRLRSLLPRRTRIVVRRRGEVLRRGRSVNVVMVRAGLARVNRASGRRLRRRLRSAQQSARKRAVGIFGNCRQGRSPIPGPDPPDTPLQPPADAPGPGDHTPPEISSIDVVARVDSATVAWSTNEPATSTVAFGVTTEYLAEPVRSSGLVSERALTLLGLACNTMYHFRVSSADAAGNASRESDRVFKTGACPATGAPVIDVWYGREQRFGQLGRAQRWVNVLGDVSDPDGVQWAGYYLNDGPGRPLTISPDVNLRIAQFGDFNVEIDEAELQSGQNTVEIVAKDGTDSIRSKTVVIQYTRGRKAPLPSSATWSAVQKIEDAAQVVDGKWKLQDGAVRTAAPGYDRVIAVGDTTWTDYEVTVPVTIHGLSATSPHAGVGLAAGWQGHEGSTSPGLDWPLGGLCFYYRNATLDPYQLWMVQWPWPHFLFNDGSENTVEIGARYTWRLRTETLPDDADTARYSCKMWRAGTPEPASWNLNADLPARTGSLTLMAHHADASFGTVRITPLAP